MSKQKRKLKAREIEESLVRDPLQEIKEKKRDTHDNLNVFMLSGYLEGGFYSREAVEKFIKEGIYEDEGIGKDATVDDAINKGVFVGWGSWDDVKWREDIEDWEKHWNEVSKFGFDLDNPRCMETGKQLQLHESKSSIVPL